MGNDTMNQSQKQAEIIRIAREAGLVRTGDGWTEPHRWGLAEIKAFANLVAAHKAEVALAEAYRCGYEAGVVEEREACAKVCERDDSIRCLAAAQAIRARGAL